jgi:hypothetical protein
MALSPRERVIAAIEAAREQLEIAAAILRGDETDASAAAMRAEQQVTRALGALWGIVVP